MKKIAVLFFVLFQFSFSEIPEGVYCPEDSYWKLTSVSHNSSYEYCSFVAIEAGIDVCVAEVEEKYYLSTYRVFSSTTYQYRLQDNFTYKDNTSHTRDVSYDILTETYNCTLIPTCDEGKYFNTTTEQCEVSCPAGTIRNGDTCVCEDFTKYFDANTSTCISPCDPTDEPLPIIPYLDDPKNACSSGNCPVEPMCHEDDFLPCEDGWHSLNLIIVDCEGVTVEDVHFCSSVPCSDIYAPNGDDNSTDTPQDCSLGQYYDACHGKCVDSCPPGTVWSNKTEQCECWDTPPPTDDNNTDDNNTDDTDDDVCSEGEHWDNFWQACVSDSEDGSDSDGGSTTTIDNNDTDDNATGDDGTGDDDNATGDTGDGTGDDDNATAEYEDEAQNMKDEAEKEYKDTMGEFARVLDGHLDVFRSLGTEFSNIFIISAPNVSAGGTCIFSTTAYGKTFKIDLGFAIKFAPYFKMILNLILAFLIIRLYVFIFRDISNKFFAGGD